MEITGREYEALAAHAGSAYLRYSFTKGTEQEARFLISTLGLRRGMRVLDVGCGPGRHSHALRRAGIEVVGVDIAQAFLAVAGEGAWVRGDARRLPFSPRSFDAAICMCQGGFGLLGADQDGSVLDEMVSVVRLGGRVAVSAFSAYFMVRYLDDGDDFDVEWGINHEVAEVKNSEGLSRPFDHFTACFTPRELRLLAAASGIEIRGLWSVNSGDFAERPPDLDHPEFLLIGDV